MKIWKYFFGFLALTTLTVWLAVLSQPQDSLKLIACDVGQGDAILAISGSNQVLIDGGPGGKVMNCLERHMPFWDRQIEGVLLTHPQKDHYGGLIEVFKNYDVELFVANGLDSSSENYQVLKSLVGGSGARVVNPIEGMSMRFGLIYLDIVHPTEAFLAANSGENGQQLVKNTGESNGVLGAYTSSRDPNDFSIVAILRFDDFEALLTGDIGPEISDLVANVIYANNLGPFNYIKVPHHGSKNGMSQKLLDVVEPEIAVISAGKNNTYGHPHEEILNMLREARYLPAGRQVKILRTDELGDVSIEVKGEDFTVNK